MAGNRRRETDDIILEAVDLSAGQRRRFLNEVCPDPELRREIEESLLRYDRLEFLEVPLVPLPVEIPASALQGHTVGAYRLGSELGRGGMGVVYLAERVDGHFERRVAIKVLKRGMDTDEIVRRFQNERSILATLDHPHIARLYEGGVADNGQPYFVMELIEGTPFDTYCETHGLSITERLRLFLKICDAVQFAHQNLIVHRDLKPKNILITERGEPKLLDFGIAKLLDPKIKGSTTTASNRLMTPNYASPEQLRGGPITTASDVYSLGVVLYELLTGRIPFASDLGETHGEPMLPSKAVAKHTDLGRRRRRRLAGDLDTILLKALQPQPAKRYASVERLSADLARHLSGLPVLARKPTLTYRAVKLLRRRWPIVSIAVLLLISLSGFLVSSVLHEHEMSKERDRTRKIFDVLVDVFEVSDPEQFGGSVISARELLDLGVLKVDHELDDEVEIRAALKDALARIYVNIGLYDSALPLLEEALEVRRDLLGDEHPSTFESLNHLARLHYLRGSFPQAQDLYAEARTIHSRHDPGHEARTEYLLGLGMLRSAQARFDEAEALFARVEESYETVLRPGPGKMLDLFTERAWLYSETGRYSEAEALYLQALETAEDSLGADHLKTHRLMGHLANLYMEQGRYDDAEPLFQSALERMRAILGDEHPAVAAKLVHNMAILHELQGRYDAAEALLLDALERSRSRLGENHPYVGGIMNTLGVLYKNWDRPQKAEDYLRGGLEIRIRAFGPVHPLVATSFNNLGTLFSTQSRFEESEEALLKSLEIRRSVFGSRHPNVATALNNLSTLLMRKGEVDEAARFLREAMEVMAVSIGSNHPDFATAANNLASIHQKRGRYDQAERLFRQALATREHLFGPDHLDVANSLNGLGLLLKDLGRYGEAEPMLVRALESCERSLGPEHRIVARMHANLGLLFLEQGMHDAAEVSLKRALDLYSRRFAPTHPWVLEARKGYAELLREQGRADEARAFDPDHHDLGLS